MNNQPAYKILASLVGARLNCIRSGNAEWKSKHESRIEQIVSDFLPSGSGWGNGTKLDFDHSTGEKLVFFGGWHHMNDGGYYDGWTEHSVTVRASLAFDLAISISGRDRNAIKDHLTETFDYALSTVLVWDAQQECYVDARYAIIDPFKNVAAV